MRILVDSCAYYCQNLGDMAMLTVAVSRLRELWPQASLRVITSAPDRIALHCGEVETVPARGRELLLQEHVLGPLRRLLPAGVRSRLDRREARLRLRWPGAFSASLRLKARLRGRDARDVARFLAALESADLYVLNGAGILTDVFKEKALAILAGLELAIRRGTPTAVCGQGLGPLADPDLVRRAREVLPRVTQIALRESRGGLPLLASLDVDPAKIVVTGDDAIELAYPGAPRGQPAAAGGESIGVNVRVATYSEVAQATLSALKEALAAAARAHQARLVPVPVTRSAGMDVETLRELLGGADDAVAALDTPRQVIERIGGCRVMVTGSYHGAVFALAQGIPVVALARSRYYVDKMTGLAHQFGLGCEVVGLDGSDLSARLVAAIDRGWADAERVRAPLLERAAAQIKSSRAAYLRLRDIIGPFPASRLSAGRAARLRAT
jgi:colanic acid/amylovoran biosynthesis protein